ncbi:hypothetical protein LY78DRAFT_411348 [Colletotrichum sublineola]|nr:hypothetical protein LY78DRAFT_411348 [Colletotrichum sublineola]
MPCQCLSFFAHLEAIPASNIPPYLAESPPPPRTRKKKGKMEDGKERETGVTPVDPGKAGCDTKETASKTYTRAQTNDPPPQSLSLSLSLRVSSHLDFACPIPLPPSLSCPPRRMAQRSILSEITQHTFFFVSSLPRCSLFAKKPPGPVLFLAPPPPPPHFPNPSPRFLRERAFPRFRLAILRLRCCYLGR